MKKFDNLKEYSDDELIILVYNESDNWQKEAVEYAKLILEERGVSVDYSKNRIHEINVNMEALWKKELYHRKHESYHIFELILMALFWFKPIYGDWDLKKRGYLKKRKQRLYALGSGILLYIIIAIPSILISEKQMANEHIESIVADSIAISQIDWSGKYVFLDSLDTNDGVRWEIVVKKEKTEHSAIIKLLKRNDSILINCVGLIKKENIEFYPDKTYQLFDDVEITFYDRLLTLMPDKKGVYTYWGRMIPFYNKKYNGTDLFRKKAANNVL